MNNYPIIADDSIVTEYTDYYIDTPDFFIEYIQKKIKLRDIRGLTNDRIQAINITGEHPLVTLTAAVLSNQQKLDVSGFLPAIAIVESDESEEFETFGYGKRNAFTIDEDWINTFKASHGDIKLRKSDGLLSNLQLDKIEQAVTNAKDAIKNPKGAILAYLEGHFIRESVFISSWVGTVDEQNIIGNVLRSIIYSMKNEMVNRNIKDIHIKSSGGLVNSNFGRIIHGRETTIDFINVFHTVTVTKDLATENIVDNTNNITIFDTAENAYIDIMGSLDANLKYKAVATQDNYVDQSGTEL